MDLMISTYEQMLNSMSDGFYILDQDGYFMFINSFCQSIHDVPSDYKGKMNAFEYYEEGKISVCISEQVLKKKEPVVMIQDVETTQKQLKKYKQLVKSTPILNENGDIKCVFAVVKPLDTMYNDYLSAVQYKPFNHRNGTNDNQLDNTGIIANSQAMTELFSVAKTIAQVDISVLLNGESGTGKEVLAQYIHDCSARSQHKMVVVNAASIPENLIESELFGYEKGAFTGSSPNGKKGLIEIADKGTLFLDEINSLPIGVQSKLLRVLETRTIQRIGSTQTTPVDFRLITATNENLQSCAQEGRFRSDLYYRINVMPLTIPALRDRKDDIFALALNFLRYYCEQYKIEKVFLAQEVDYMMNYHWPGNVRELKNYVQRLVVTSTNEEIDHAFLLSMNHSTKTKTMGANQSIPFDQLLSSGVSLKSYVEDCERQYIEAALKKYNSTYKAAAALQTNQSLIMRRKEKYAIEFNKEYLSF